MTEVGASLYNRHRPARFEDMVGQDHVARALGNALRSGRPAQGFLFSGPRGTGKTTTARILARCLNCQSSPGPTATPCGTCDSCRRTGQQDWLDVVEVDAASSARRIEEMREWLETVRYAPVASRYRITIMDEAHQIQEQAASALLKTLEEPPPHLVVILCTTHPWQILGTIRSRLQQYVLRKPGVPALVRVLDRVARAEGITASESALDILARAADGSYRDALGLLDQLATYTDGRVEPSDALELIGAVGRETMFELVDLMASGQAAGAFELLESTLDGPVDPEQAMRGLVHHLRHVCLLQQGARPRDEWAFAPDELLRLQEQANQLSAAQVVRGLDLLSDAQVRIRHGGSDPRLQLELVAARLSRPALDASSAALEARVQALEAGRPQPPASAAVRPDLRVAAPEAEASRAPGPAPTATPQPAPPTPPPSGAASAPDPPAPLADSQATPAAAPPAAASRPTGPDPAAQVPPAQSSSTDEAGPPPEVRAQIDAQADAHAAAHLDDPGTEPPPPMPEPPPTDVPFDLEHFGRLWPQVLAHLQDFAMESGFMVGSQPRALGDGQVTVAVSSPGAMAMLNRPDSRSRVAGAIRDVTGHRAAVVFEVSAEARAPEPSGTLTTAPVGDAPIDGDALLNEFKTMFNAVEVDGGKRSR